MSLAHARSRVRYGSGAESACGAPRAPIVALSRRGESVFAASDAASNCPVSGIERLGAILDSIRRLETTVRRLNGASADVDWRSICAVAERCGGCPELGRSRTEQHTRKLAHVVRALREAGVTPPHEIEWDFADTIDYRN